MKIIDDFMQSANRTSCARGISRGAVVLEVTHHDTRQLKVTPTGKLSDQPVAQCLRRVLEGIIASTSIPATGAELWPFSIVVKLPIE